MGLCKDVSGTSLGKKWQFLRKHLMSVTWTAGIGRILA